jgi:hypothetical protein
MYAVKVKYEPGSVVDPDPVRNFKKDSDPK